MGTSLDQTTKDLMRKEIMTIYSNVQVCSSISNIERTTSLF